jgi:secondary thiamine-phosphate synthase enzyme
LPDGEAIAADKQQRRTRRNNQLKILSDVISIRTRARLELVDLTDQIGDILNPAKIKEGFIHLMSLHTTTGLFVNEWQQALIEDMRKFIQKMVDDADTFAHNLPENGECERQNASAHLRALILGNSLSLPIKGGKILLGKWQRIILAELDGPQERTLQVQVIGK